VQLLLTDWSSILKIHPCHHLPLRNTALANEAMDEQKSWTTGTSDIDAPRVGGRKKEAKTNIDDKRDHDNVYV
jgi:hypothetical protein